MTVGFAPPGTSRAGPYRVAAIIAAAGVSRRMEGIDKVFTAVLGWPLVDYSIRCCEASAEVDDVVLVTREEMVMSLRSAAMAQGWGKVRAVVEGGARRQDSVKAGLAALQGCDWVVVHDGARPCVSEAIIRRGLAAAHETGAAVAAVPAKDTVKLVGDDLLVTSTPPRQGVWLVQTPQIFAYDIIAKAYESSNSDVTDDAALVEQAGYKVKVFMGAYTNIKVTTPDDLAVVESFLRGGLRS